MNVGANGHFGAAAGDGGYCQAAVAGVAEAPKARVVSRVGTLPRGEFDARTSRVFKVKQTDVPIAGLRDVERGEGVRRAAQAGKLGGEDRPVAFQLELEAFTAGNEKRPIASRGNRHDAGRIRHEPIEIGAGGLRGKREIACKSATAAASPVVDERSRGLHDVDLECRIGEDLLRDGRAAD